MLAKLCVAVVILALGVNAKKPNVLFVLTDDQDLILDSLSSQPKLRKLITEQGAYFTNHFCNTPICCPSRAEIQSARYMHNTKVYDNGCGGTDWQKGPEMDNVAHYASQAGYVSYYSGKYLNNYGSKDVGGTAHIPQGWNAWHALVGNSKYYNYDVSDNGKEEHYGDNYYSDYYTDKLKNDSASWLTNDWNSSQPFFMTIGTPCPHVPNVFAPQYANKYTNISAPRWPNWNMAPATETGPHAKHWMMRHFGPMDATHINNSDLTFQDRWRCLQSVDDLVERLVNVLESKGELDNTYIIYTADHGQHLGEFAMGFDKRQLYETDIRVPMIVRGPNITPGTVVDGITTHIDLGVSFLDMMGLPKPAVMDGTSWLGLVVNNTASPERRFTNPNLHLNVDTPFRTNSRNDPWRHDFLIEYGGPSVDGVFPKTSPAAPPNKDYPCGVGYSCDGLTLCGGEHGTCPCDARNNTYKCLRTLNATENSIYCEFDDNENFVEWYDITKDPYQMNNLATNGGDPTKKAALHARLRAYMLCAGDNCFDPPPNPKPPVPPGSSQIQKDGQCIKCDHHCVESGALALGSCDDPTVSAWLITKDPLGYGEVQSAETTSQCFNLDDVKCASGTTVHLHECQTTKSGSPHVGNRFSWNSTASVFESTPCPGMCIGTSSSGLVLLPCSSSDAQGWQVVS
eukprot:m.71006 g.71006  ORF g.71006 m.71006 type:complete len:682 (+) comp20126_c0_seq1:44-2089(+)